MVRFVDLSSSSMMMVMITIIMIGMSILCQSDFRIYNSLSSVLKPIPFSANVSTSVSRVSYRSMSQRHCQPQIRFFIDIVQHFIHSLSSNGLANKFHGACNTLRCVKGNTLLLRYLPSSLVASIVEELKALE